MREPKNKNRTTLTLIGEDVEILIELQRKLEAKYNFPLRYIDVVRRAMRELQSVEK
jgi:hypothetical protein